MSGYGGYPPAPSGAVDPYGNYYQQQQQPAIAALPFMNFQAPSVGAYPPPTGYPVVPPQPNYYQQQQQPTYYQQQPNYYQQQPNYYQQPSQPGYYPPAPTGNYQQPSLPAATAPRVRQATFKQFTKEKEGSGPLLGVGTTSAKPGCASSAGLKSLRGQLVNNAFFTRPKWSFNWNKVWCYEEDYQLKDYPNALQLVSCGSDSFISGIQIWNRNNGEATTGAVQVLDGPLVCNAVDANPRAGNYGIVAIFGGSTKGARLTLWDVEKAKIKRESLFEGESEFSCGACTWHYGTGAAIAGSATQSNIRVYDIERGALMRKIALPEGNIISIVVDPVVPTVFYCAFASGAIQAFDLLSPADQPSIVFGNGVDPSNGGKEGTKGVVGFARPKTERTSTCRSIAAAGPQEVRLWDLASPSLPIHLLKPPPSKLFSGIGFSGDTICTYAEELQIWNLLSGDLSKPTSTLAGCSLTDCGATMKMTSTSVFFGGKVGTDQALFEVNLL